MPEILSIRKNTSELILFWAIIPFFKKRPFFFWLLKPVAKNKNCSLKKKCKFLIMNLFVCSLKGKDGGENRKLMRGWDGKSQDEFIICPNSTQLLRGVTLLQGCWGESKAGRSQDMARGSQTQASHTSRLTVRGPCAPDFKVQLLHPSWHQTLMLGMQRHS